MIIETPRLFLLAGTADRLRAELQGITDLAAALRAEIPSAWPPPLYDEAAVRWMLERVEADPVWATWGSRYFLHKQEGGPIAVGAGGFKGPPNAEGTVELGYSVLPQYQRQGFATEAVEGMLAFARQQTEVRRVTAETLPTLVPSIGVLEKTGFDLTEEAAGDGVLRFARNFDGP